MSKQRIVPLLTALAVAASPMTALAANNTAPGTQTSVCTVNNCQETGDYSHNRDYSHNQHSKTNQTQHSNRSSNTTNNGHH